MPAAVSAPSAAPVRSLQDQADALWAFVHLKVPGFTPVVAANVVSELAPLGGELKPLAKRLREALGRHGTAIKQDAALGAAARLLGYATWHAARRAATDGLISVTRFGAQDRVEKSFSGWSDVGTELATICDQWVATHGGRLFQVHIGQNKLSLTVPLRELEGGEEFGRRPVVLVKPMGWSGDWLGGAVSALEHLRRRVEETGKAVLDGFAVAQLCHMNAHTNFLGGSAAQAANSELVLRQSAARVGADVEIGRGDEMTCWAELNLSTQVQDVPSLADDGAWVVKGKRFVWSVQTSAEMQSSMVLSTMPLNPEQSRKLFRRYRIAHRVFQGQLVRYDPIKDLAYLESVPEFLPIDLPELLSRMREQGLTWEAYASECGEAVEKSATLPLPFLQHLLKRLSTRDPHNLLQVPDRANLTLIENDEILGHLMPRVEHVRYQLPAWLQPGKTAQLTELIENFRVGALALQLNAENSTAAGSGREPYSAFSVLSTELRSGIRALGLVLHAGVMYHLSPNDQEQEQRAQLTAWEGAEIWPFGLSYALYLDLSEEDAK